MLDSIKDYIFKFTIWPTNVTDEPTNNKKNKKKLQYFISNINYYPSTCEIIEKLKLHQTKPNLNLKRPPPPPPLSVKCFFFIL